MGWDFKSIIFLPPRNLNDFRKTHIVLKLKAIKTLNPLKTPQKDEEDNVPDNWEDEEKPTKSVVKDNWDDEEEEVKDSWDQEGI